MCISFRIIQIRYKLSDEIMRLVTICQNSLLFCSKNNIWTIFYPPTFTSSSSLKCRLLFLSKNNIWGVFHPDMIFVIFFTQAIFLTFWILPEENALIATFLVPWYDNLSFLRLKWELRMRILLLLAHLKLCHWFTWLNITKNQNDTQIHIPKTHS